MVSRHEIRLPVRSKNNLNVKVLAFSVIVKSLRTFVLSFIVEWRGSNEETRRLEGTF